MIAGVLNIYFIPLNGWKSNEDCFAVFVRELFLGVSNFENDFCLNLKSTFSKIVLCCLIGQILSRSC